MEKRTHEGQHPSTLKTLNIFINQIHPLSEYIWVQKYGMTLSCISSIMTSSLTSFLEHNKVILNNI